MTYEFKLPPFNHQQETFDFSADLAEYAVFWEQGTGKTKVTLDTACSQFEAGTIDAVLVVAPNGVHRNWTADEIPTHTPDRIFKNAAVHCYQTKKAKRAWHKEAVQKLMDYKGGIKFLAMSYDAMMTKEGRRVAKEFLVKHKVFYTIDEAARIKSPRAKRSMTVVASGKYAVSRRALTGTPVANSPFDVYNIMKFLNEDFWKPHGFTSYTVFKFHFGVWEKKYNGKTQREFDSLVCYKNLDQLYGILKEASSRVTKDEVLDLPPKLYSKRYFEMTPSQQKLYNQIRDDFMVLMECGEMITAPLAITRLLRLQQITCGYIPLDGDEGGNKMMMVDNENARLAVLTEIIEDINHKTIIWSRFTKDIDLIMARLLEMGRKPVRYDGKTNDEDRAEAVARFQGRRPIMENGVRIGWDEIPEDEQATDFVGNPAAAGEGLTLHAARNMIYYNNSFKLTDRLQSEDRAHRIGQEHPVNYIDIIAEDSVDEHIVNALRNKQQIAAQVLGDKLKEWL